MELSKVDDKIYDKTALHRNEKTLEIEYQDELDQTNQDTTKSARPFSQGSAAPTDLRRCQSSGRGAGLSAGGG